MTEAVVSITGDTSIIGDLMAVVTVAGLETLTVIKPNVVNLNQTLTNSAVNLTTMDNHRQVQTRALQLT